MIECLSPLIYVVDDDEDDRYLLKTVFTEHYEQCMVRSFDCGSTLLTQLTHRLDGRLPDLIILDLEMPVISGLELLRLLKQDSAFRSIPVVILTGSRLAEHIDQCYALGTTAYLNKAVSYTQLVDGIGHLQRYWSVKANQWPKRRSTCLIEGLDLTNLPLN